MYTGARLPASSGLLLLLACGAADKAAPARSKFSLRTGLDVNGRVEYVGILPTLLEEYVLNNLVYRSGIRLPRKELFPLLLNLLFELI